MTPAQALWALWTAMTLGLAGCVKQAVRRTCRVGHHGTSRPIPRTEAVAMCRATGRGLSRMRALRVGVPDAHAPVVAPDVVGGAKPGAPLGFAPRVAEPRRQGSAQNE